MECLHTISRTNAQRTISKPNVVFQKRLQNAVTDGKNTKFLVQNVIGQITTKCVTSGCKEQEICSLEESPKSHFTEVAASTVACHSGHFFPTLMNLTKAIPVKETKSSMEKNAVPTHAPAGGRRIGVGLTGHSLNGAIAPTVLVIELLNTNTDFLQKCSPRPKEKNGTRIANAKVTTKTPAT